MKKTLTEELAVVGLLCSPKSEAWDACLRDGRLGPGLPWRQPQPIVRVGDHPPYYVMLAFPLWWWKIEELEIEE
jgi:hypothetical protein